MMPCYSLSAGGINHCPNTIAGFQLVRPHFDSMPDRLTLRLHVDNANLRPTPAEGAGVGRLPAALRVKGRFLEKHVSALRFADHRKDLGNGRLRFQLVVADEPAGTSSQRG